MSKLFSHLKTVLTHKRYVRKACWKMGLYKQGILHDMSKFSPSEFIPGVRYYQGIKSPNTAERDEKGYSLAWLHHKGRNKHHFEYWVDYTHKSHVQMPVDMPLNYLCEMVADRYAACRTYQKDKYSKESPLKYFLWGKDEVFMHENTKKRLEKILTVMANQGEDAAFAYAKKLLKDEGFI